MAKLALMRSRFQGLAAGGLVGGRLSAVDAAGRGVPKCRTLRVRFLCGGWGWACWQGSELAAKEGTSTHSKTTNIRLWQRWL